MKDEQTPAHIISHNAAKRVKQVSLISTYAHYKRRMPLSSLDPSFGGNSVAQQIVFRCFSDLADRTAEGSNIIPRSPLCYKGFQ